MQTRRAFLRNLFKIGATVIGSSLIPRGALAFLDAPMARSSGGGEHGDLSLDELIEARDVMNSADVREVYANASREAVSQQVDDRVFAPSHDKIPLVNDFKRYRESQLYTLPRNVCTLKYREFQWSDLAEPYKIYEQDFSDYVISRLKISAVRQGISWDHLDIFHVPGRVDVGRKDPFCQIIASGFEVVRTLNVG